MSGRPRSPSPPSPRTHLQAEGGSAAPQELADVAQALGLRARLREHLQGKRWPCSARGPPSIPFTIPFSFLIPPGSPLTSPPLPSAGGGGGWAGLDPGSKQGAQEMAGGAGARLHTGRDEGKGKGKGKGEAAGTLAAC